MPPKVIMLFLWLNVLILRVNKDGPRRFIFVYIGFRLSSGFPMASLHKAYALRRSDVPDLNRFVHPVFLDFVGLNEGIAETVSLVLGIYATWFRSRTNTQCYSLLWL